MLQVGTAHARLGRLPPSPSGGVATEAAGFRLRRPVSRALAPEVSAVQMKTTALKATAGEAGADLVPTEALLAIAHEVHRTLLDGASYMFPALQSSTWAAIRMSFLSLIIWWAMVVLVAWRYRENKKCVVMAPHGVPSSPCQQDFSTWTSGPFDCLQDLKICFWAFLCPCIRWADNVDMVGIAGFWAGLSLFGCFLFFLHSLASAILLWFVASLFSMSFRHELRRRFGMECDSTDAYCADWALHCCCWPCTVAQEARHLEEAMKAGHMALAKPAASPMPAL